jgi:hypothetical protein
MRCEQVEKLKLELKDAIDKMMLLHPANGAIHSQTWRRADAYRSRHQMKEFDLSEKIKAHQRTCETCRTRDPVA